MAKNGFLTPKAIANRIKAKGLQKLRWYCQMCQKQCRDENGFKCHLSSDGHRRQMEVFGQAPTRIIDGYSEEFHNSFMEHLRVAHPHVRIEAHKVYNEYIQDKNHIHMNATKWLTLTEYVKYLGREGLCKVEDSPKGWFIQLIHRDGDEERKEAERAARRKGEAEEAARQQRQIEAQIERARAAEATAAAAASAAGAASSRDGSRLDGAAPSVRSGPVELDMGLSTAPSASAAPVAVKQRGGGGLDESAFSAAKATGPSSGGAEAGDNAGAAQKKRKRSHVDELMEAERTKKAAAAASMADLEAGTVSQPWLVPHIVVKVVSRAPALREYVDGKGEVIAVDGFVGEIEMLASGDVLRVDQAELETVIPKPGRDVKVVMGSHRGEIATVVDILRDVFQIEVKLASGSKVRLEYEAVCKKEEQLQLTLPATESEACVAHAKLHMARVSRDGPANRYKARRRMLGDLLDSLYLVRPAARPSL